MTVRDQLESLSAIEGIRSRYVTDKNGRLVVSYRSQNGGTLRNRYMQAEMTVRNNPAVRAAWTNMVRDMLGLPRDSAAPPWVTS
jgi:hypothetical protein